MSKKRTQVARFKLSTLSWTNLGIDYAIHTLRDQYHKASAHAVSLIDAENAFNSRNRKLELTNIKNTGQYLLTAIKNSYSNPSKLFINKKQSTLKNPGGPTSSDHKRRSSHNTPHKAVINSQRYPEMVRRRWKHSR